MKSNAKTVEFEIARHAEVDKKHPAGEQAPLTEEGAEQAKAMARYCQESVVGLAILPSEDLPRFSQAAIEMEAVGIRVERVEGISFKNLKGATPIREIATTYRAAGLALMRRLAADESTPTRVMIIGSYPLIAGLRFDPATATEEELDAKPGFCTGLVAQLDDNGQLVVTNPDFHPLD